MNSNIYNIQMFLLVLYLKLKTINRLWNLDSLHTAFW